MVFSISANLEKNHRAIQKALELRNAQASATSEDKAILRGYVGFGGIKEILLNENNPETWSQTSLKYLGGIKNLKQMLRDNTQSDEEYFMMIAQLKSSVLSAFYTPEVITETITSSLASVAPSRVLESSAGTGRFLDALDKTNTVSQYTAYEIDYLTALILSKIHDGPNKEIINAPFETIKNRNGYFDLAISNIPFGNFRVFDEDIFNNYKPQSVERYSMRNVMDYFFVKNLLCVHDSGVVTIITSSAFSDNPAHNPAREYLMKNSDLISAVRFPNNTFMSDANTEVQTDLIILQKNTQKKVLKPIEIDYARNNVRKEINYNAVFTDVNRLIFTKGERKTDQYGRPYNSIIHEGGTDGIAKALGVILEKDLRQLRFVPKQIQQDESVIAPAESNKRVKKSKEVYIMRNLFDNFVDNGQADKTVAENITIKISEIQKFGYPEKNITEGQYVNYKGKAARIETVQGDSAKISIPENKDENDKILLYVELRNTYYNLFEYEKSTGETSDIIRLRLNELYDKFVQTYGSLEQILNIADPHVKDINRLTNTDGKKADIFYKNIFVFEAKDLSVPEAFVACLNKNGSFNIDFISKYTGIQSEEVIIEELKGFILFDPDTQRIEVKERALYGNLNDKILKLEEYCKNHPSDTFAYESIEIYKENMPLRVGYDIIDFNLGERWIPTNIYEIYSEKLFGTSLKVHYISDSEVSGRNDAYIIDDRGVLTRQMKEAYAIRNEQGDIVMGGMRVFQSALTDTIPKITKDLKDDEGNVIHGPDGKPIKVPDAFAIQQAIIQVETIRNQFSDFMKYDLAQNHRDFLEELYNKKFNAYARVEYNGDHLHLEDLNLENLGIKGIRPAQKSAIWQNLVLQGGINDHEVGLGKTLTMCITAHEGKRMGIWSKPLIVGMKANIDEIAATYKSAYPLDRVLYLDNFSAKNVTSVLNQIKNNDYDAIIVSKEGLSRIPLDNKLLAKTLSEELVEMENAYSYIDADMNKSVAKRLERSIKDLESQLKEVQSELKKKNFDVPSFDELGIDHLLIDESQNYKNLRFSTRHTGVPGIGNVAGSQQANGLLNYIRSIQDKKGTDLHASFYSGTPISNSLSELYLLFKYLTPQELKKQSLLSFDAWVAVYARKTVDYEISVTNEIIQKPRFRTYVKIPELAMSYKRITNYKTIANDTDIVRPKIKEKLVAVEQNELQERYNEALKQFALTGDASYIGKENTEGREMGKMLVVTSEAQKAAIDIRLVFPDAQVKGPCKATEVVKECMRVYEETDKDNGVQLLFCDSGTPSNLKDFTLYDELRKLLLSRGIPAREIAIIHENDTTQKRKELFKKVNSGDVRFVIGSSDKLGTGTNVQRRCAAIHHIDITWKPSIHEQRNGRGWRQHNSFSELEIIYYATKQSLDHYKFSLNKDKKTFIDQIKRASATVRMMDEGADNGINFEEYLLNIEDGSRKMVLEKRTLEKRVSQLQTEKAIFEQLKNNKADPLYIQSLEKSIAANKNTLANLTFDFDEYSKYKDEIPFYKALSITGFRLFDQEKDTMFSETENRDVIKKEYITELGTYLTNAVDVVNNGNAGDTELGQIGNFRIMIEAKNYLSSEDNLPMKKTEVNIVSPNGQLRYNHWKGNLPVTPLPAGYYLRNCFKGLENLISSAKTNILNKENELKQALNIKQSVWGKSELLENTMQSLKQLSIEIEVNKAKNIEKQMIKRVEKEKLDNNESLNSQHQKKRGI